MEWNQLEARLTPQQYVNHLRRLGLTTAAAAPVLGILRRQSFRYAAGDAPVPEVVAKLVKALVALGRTEV